MDTIALNKDTLNQLYVSAKQKKRDKSINHLNDIIAAFSSEYDYGDCEKEPQQSPSALCVMWVTPEGMLSTFPQSKGFCMKA